MVELKVLLPSVKLALGQTQPLSEYANASTNADHALRLLGSVMFWDTCRKPLYLKPNVRKDHAISEILRSSLPAWIYILKF